VESFPSDFIVFSLVDLRHEPQSGIGQVFKVEITKQELLKSLLELRDNLANVWV
jgi:hypothetical protein